MHERRFKQPLRYKGHDYRAPCSAHVTICTHRRQSLFGEIASGGLVLSDAGCFVETALLQLHRPESGIEIDTHIIMPDHLHVIFHLGTHPEVIPTSSIPDLVRIFKMRVLKFWPQGIRNRGWSRYETHLWQPSFYDTLIRTPSILKLPAYTSWRTRPDGSNAYRRTIACDERVARPIRDLQSYPFPSGWRGSTRIVVGEREDSTLRSGQAIERNTRRVSMSLQKVSRGSSSVAEDLRPTQRLCGIDDIGRNVLPRLASGAVFVIPLPACVPPSFRFRRAAGRGRRRNRFPGRCLRSGGVRLR